MIRILLLSFFPHYSTLLQYSEAVVRRIRRIYRKTTVLESLFWQSCRPIRKETPTQMFFKNTSGELRWTLSFCLKFFWQFFARIPEIIGIFRERFIFQMIGLFLLFMSGFYTMKPRLVDKSSNRTKQCLFDKV